MSCKIESILSIANDARALVLVDILGLTGPGGYALRESDGRVMVWASEADSVDDDGARAIYRSAAPVSAAGWAAIASLAWIGDSEEA